MSQSHELYTYNYTGLPGTRCQPEKKVSLTYRISLDHAAGFKWYVSIGLIANWSIKNLASYTAHWMLVFTFNAFICGMSYIVTE